MIKSVDFGAGVPGFESSMVISSCMVLGKSHFLLAPTL